MNFLELQEQVMRETGRTDKAESIPYYLNWALTEVVRAGARRNYNFRDLVRVESIYTYPHEDRLFLPDDCRTVLNVVLRHEFESRSLTYLLPRTYDREILYSQKEYSMPSVYTQKERGMLHLARGIPDSFYELLVRYSKWPGEMDYVRDQPELRHIDDLLIALAVYKVYMAIGLPQEALAWKALSNSMLVDVIEADRQKGGDWHPKAKGFSTVSWSGSGVNNPFV